jgi:hypothetical protein
MEGKYNFDEKEADCLFRTNDKDEAIEAAKDFGQGTTVVTLDKKGKRERVFTASYESDIALKE